ncbi:S-adenosyl-L-methionine-dependent methyltransferase [Xylaria sp. FL1777]|nr:S-adenosyl-L-methionine-dependent methyltransferase [Xylaria sp. FL1777]
MENDQDSRPLSENEWDAYAEEMPLEAEAAMIENRLRDQSTCLKQGLIRFDHGDDNGEEQDEDELVTAVEKVIDLTTEDPDLQRRPNTQPVRNPSLPLYVLTGNYDFGDFKLQPGLTVEIKPQEHAQLFQASFLYIRHIIDTPGGIKLRGIALTRLRNLRGRLPRYRNEVAMILHVDSDDKRPKEVQAAIEIHITDVIRARNCHFTNADYPRNQTEQGIYSTTPEIEQQGVLMCRWKCIFKYRDSTARIAYMNHAQKNDAPIECIIEHLNEKQASKKRFMVSDSSRFNAWRGGKVRGGEHDPENKNSVVNGPMVELDDKEDAELVMIGKKPGQRYTFGDMFCGAGGASCGAQKAGFQVKLACDNDVGACKTYTEAFPEAQLYRKHVFEFITKETSMMRVDVMHLSPPCQFWSPAHTVPGENDEANIAVLFSCQELVRKLRPRLFTLEQTFGILHPRFEFYFNGLIHGFTDSNYSVRWKIVDLVDWGSPATRKRLIMIGSCPGEDLPPFPKATHVAPGIKKRGRKPHVTVKKMLERIPYDASRYDDMHQPRDMVRKNLERWDPNVTLSRCITTNGGYGNYHPNGRRDFTLREYATLQTFPVDYPFQNPNRKRQIGNAFPPMVVKVLYTHLRKWLEKKDRVYAIENEPLDLDDPDVELVDLEDEFMDDAASEDDGDLEYIGSQQLSSSSSSSTSTSQDDMVLDVSDEDNSPIPCVDPNQRRRAWPMANPGRNRRDDITPAYVDLTGDSD